MIEEEVLAKLFWITDIIRMPDARKVAKSAPPTAPRRATKASQNTSISSAEVITGASTVWIQIEAKRLTSRPMSALSPIQLTAPKRWMPIVSVRRIDYLPRSPAVLPLRRAAAVL